MRRRLVIIVLALVAWCGWAISAAGPPSTQTPPVRGLLLEDLTWPEAEKALKPDTADEIETSMMLYIDPSLVDMSKAVKDFHPSGTGGLTRDPKGKGTYSPTGIWGDPTLATREKGRIVVDAMVEGMVAEVKGLMAARS